MVAIAGRPLVTPHIDRRNTRGLIPLERGHEATLQNVCRVGPGKSEEKKRRRPTVAAVAEVQSRRFRVYALVDMAAIDPDALDGCEVTEEQKAIAEAFKKEANEAFQNAKYPQAVTLYGKVRLLYTVRSHQWSRSTGAWTLSRDALVDLGDRNQPHVGNLLLQPRLRPHGVHRPASSCETV